MEMNHKTPLVPVTIEDTVVSSAVQAEDGFAVAAQLSVTKPNLFIVGVPKCGTSSMYTYLDRHPQVFMPTRKEPHFFGTDLDVAWWIRDEQEYLRLFAGAGEEKWIGEASIWYLYSKRAAAEIRAYRPEARIIAMLRNPVEMMHALHSHNTYFQREDLLDFGEAIDAEEDRKQGRRIPKNVMTVQRLFYREVARYAGQLERYFAAFGRERVHVIIYDDLKQDTAAVYRGVCEFLQIDPSVDAGFEVVNRNKRLRSAALYQLEKDPPRWLHLAVTTLLPKPVRRTLRGQLQRMHTSREPRPPIAPELRRRLQAEFVPEVATLSDLLHRDLSHWCTV